MRENHADFGFDEDEPIVEADKRNPWDYMCDILLPKGNRTTLWLCIQQMNNIKKLYNKIVA